MSDAVKQLGDGYWLSIEGRDNNRIFSGEAYGKGIHADVIEYDYSDNYIVAKEKPIEFDDPADSDDVISYPYGRDTVYYWIILKKKRKRIGPLSEQEFKYELNKNNLPLEIEWQTIYGD